jgi:4-diphosphocytidyl-2-C-methyl-D-erythritol kinase
VTPATPIPTAEAYGWVDAARQAAGRRGAVALDLDALSRWGDIGRLAGNDFESAVFGRHPEIRAAFEALAGTRPLVCGMSGSGSTLFAIYRSARDRDDARMLLGRRHGALTSVETLAAPPPT